MYIQVLGSKFESQQLKATGKIGWKHVLLQFGLTCKWFRNELQTRVTVFLASLKVIHGESTR